MIPSTVHRQLLRVYLLRPMELSDLTRCHHVTYQTYIIPLILQRKMRQTNFCLPYEWHDICPQVTSILQLFRDFVEAQIRNLKFGKFLGSLFMISMWYEYVLITRSTGYLPLLRWSCTSHAGSAPIRERWRYGRLTPIHGSAAAASQLS